MNILERLRSRMIERTGSNADILAAAARRTAAGENVDHAAVESALEMSGQTVEDFEDMVALAQRRQEWFRSLDALPSATATATKAQSGLDAAGATFEATRLAHDVVCTRLNADATAAASRIHEAVQARGNLLLPANVFEPLSTKLADARATAAAAKTDFDATEWTLREDREAEKLEQNWIEHKKAAGDNQYSSGEGHELLLKRVQRRIAGHLETLELQRLRLSVAKQTLADIEAQVLKT